MTQGTQAQTQNPSGKYSDEEIRKRSQAAFEEGRRGGVPATKPTDPVDDAEGDVTDTVESVDEAGNVIARTRPRRPRKSDTAEDVDDEVRALGACSRELAKLSPEARSRVLLYLARRHEPPRESYVRLNGIRYGMTEVSINPATRTGECDIAEPLDGDDA